MIKASLRITSYLLPKEWRNHLRTIRSMNLVTLRDLCLCGGLIVLSTLLEAFSVSMILPLFEYIENDRDLEVLADKGRFWSVLIRGSELINVPISLLSLCLIILGLVILRQVSNYHSTMTLISLKQKVGKNLSQRLFGAILATKPSYLQRMDSGKFLNLIDVQAQATAALIRSYATLIQQFITFILYVSVMFIAAPVASTIALGFTVLILVSLNHYIRISRNLSMRTILHRQQFSSLISERFQGWRTIKSYGALPREEVRFDQWAQKFYTLSVDMFRISGRLQLIITPVMSVLALAILYVSVDYIGLSISQISLFVIVLLRLTPVAQNFASQRQQIASFGMSLNNVVTVLQEARQEKDISSGEIVMDARSADIKLSNVSFTYNGRDEAVLNDVTLHIPAGKMIAIMGPSGAGKSTLVDLLSRFVYPTSGQITFNDTPLESFTTASLRARVAYASQVPFIFNDTVYENILYARPDATREEVEAASKSAFAHEFIELMPDGYNTMLGEGGVMLSGGQRQRLALARAFLVHPSVLILDEPTSSLDYESERKIQRAVEEMSHVQKITVIIVAHRVSTVSNADLLVILDKGRVVDIGAPTEMRKRDNWYKYAVTLEDHSDSDVEAVNT